VKKAYYILVIIFVTGIFYVWDLSIRYELPVYCPNKKQRTILISDTLSDNIKSRYKKLFKNPEFAFPGSMTARVVLYKNKTFTGQLFKKQLNTNQINQLISFLNEPKNFTWDKQNILTKQTDYILLFYDEQNRLNGKIWLCLSCGKLKATPFSPNIKFGGIDKKALKKLKNILKNTDK